ncbi:MAG: sulfatase-like hydrolase/transferase, partial [Draconibacterium sp.]|nr:sulfatase-like hydrolase/transferase [Draconibacterium sp.]
KPNVLFIAVDDLRPEATIYGQNHMVTPNLERLAESGVVFNNSFCNIPVCGASRASLLSGVRPTRTRFVNYYCRKDSDLPDYPSLPKWFKDHGYTTISNGKIYHHKDDDLEAWSETPWDATTEGVGWQDYLSETSKQIIKKNQTPAYPDLIKGPAFESADVADNEYKDGLIAEKAMADLERLKNDGKPFFLGVGFKKPHLPFNAPKKYWDLYNPDEIKLADNPFAPEGAPEPAMNEWLELRDMYEAIPTTGPVSDELNRQLVHGYYACVSYIDAQIGKMLDKLEELGLDKNTVIILWGDHGFHLGEHTLWCKHSNFHKTLRTPLIVSAPGFEKGKYTEAMTEYVDIYPSLCDLAGLPIPEHLDGTSFKPVLKDVNSSVKDAVYCRYIEGESVVTSQYTYTEWSNIAGDKYARMLYDNNIDPEENVNISEKPENEALVAEFSNRVNTFHGSIKLKDNNMFLAKNQLAVENNLFEYELSIGWRTWCGNGAEVQMNRVDENNSFGEKAFCANVNRTGNTYYAAGLASENTIDAVKNDVVKVNLFGRVTVENVPLRVQLKSDLGKIIYKDVFITDEWSPYSVKLKIPEQGTWNVEFYFMIKGAKYFMDNVVIIKEESQSV